MHQHIPVSVWAVLFIATISGCNTPASPHLSRGTLPEAISAPPSPPHLPTTSHLKVVNVETTKQVQRFVTSWMPILRPGETTGELRPAINDGIPNDGQVFVIVEVTIDFPGDAAEITLDSDLFLLDASGAKRPTAVWRKIAIKDANGKTYDGFWDWSDKFTVRKSNGNLRLLFGVRQDRIMGSAIQLHAKAYPLE